MARPAAMRRQLLGSSSAPEPSERSEYQLSRRESQDEEDERDDQEKPEQNAGNASGSRGYVRETQRAGDDRDHEEDQSPFQHGNPSALIRAANKRTRRLFQADMPPASEDLLTGVSFQRHLPMAAKNSRRVAGFRRKAPSIRLVTIATPR